MALNQSNSFAAAQLQGSSQGGNRGLPSPWLDYATITVPESHSQILWWAQYLWLMDGNFRSAMERVAAHFMTEIEFPDIEGDEESKWKELFGKKLNYRRELLACCHEYLCYGNALTSLYLPFRRFLKCQGCSLEQPISEVDYNLDFTDQDPYLIWRRTRKCFKCGDTGPYECQDRRDPDLGGIKVLRYWPEEIELAYNRWSGKKLFFWKVSELDRRDITTKARIHIDSTPLEVLQAVAVNGRLEFDDEMMHHATEPTLTGLQTKGWGLPRSIANFRTAWLQQLVNKADQAVAIDYTLGMRVISPSPTPGGTDPMQTSGMQAFAARIGAMVTEHRANPASYHTSPFPLEYKFMGGEGAALIPPDKLKFRQQEFLNQMGVPLEYHQMTLTAQGAPMAMRLFESYWQSIPALYNELLGWMVNVIGQTYGLEPTTVRIQRSALADDQMYRQVVLQLMAANQISAQTALQPYGIDATNEVQKVLKHQQMVQRLTAEYDEQAQKQQELGALKGLTANATPSALAAQQQQAAQGAMSGAPPAGVPMGGMPGGGMPGQQNQTPQSLQQLSAQADQIAQQLAPMPEYDRKQQLKALRESNKDLHALVTAALEDVRGQAASQGQAMLLSGQPPQQ